MNQITPKPRKKVKTQIKRGVVNILATYNNTIVTIADLHGNALSICSSGKVGFRGPKKSTPYAASIVVQNAVEGIRDYGIEEVDVRVKGVGSGREAAIRSLNSQGLRVMSIKDVTPIAHNGCRPRKIRRV